jgi:hypothetical protein
MVALAANFVRFLFIGGTESPQIAGAIERV